MKSLNCNLLAALLLLIAAPLAWAQDAAAPSRLRSPAPETASPAPEASATPEPQQAPAAPPAAQQESPAASPAAASPATKPAETRAASSSRRIIREKPVRAVEPRPAWTRQRRPWDELPPATVPSRPTFDLSKRGGGSASGQVRRLEQSWQRAIRDHDVETIRELVAADFVGTSTSGRTGSKSTLLSEVRRDKNTYKSSQAHSMSVRTEGANLAVVTGIAREAGVAKDGKRFSTSRRFTDTWVKRKGEWRCIASHTTQIPKR